MVIAASLGCNEAPGDVRVALDAGDQLGEGPFWDDRSGELLRVDIAGGLVQGWNPDSGHAWQRQLPGEVSAIVPRESERGAVLAAGHQLLLDDGLRLTALAIAERDRPQNRFNDCKCDPRGRLWAGTMSKRREAGAAALYRLAPGGDLDCAIAGTTISNGLGWSPAGDRMYFVDSATQRVDVLDFDAASGAIENRRALAGVEPSAGLPDGLAVDVEGGVWICLFGGGVLHRYGPEGELTAVVALPVTNPTSLAFGGADLRTLYVTSARQRLTDAQLAAEPLAGAVLALEPGIAGLPGHRFGG
jgi:sugar lactone lactonase YvrE